jgi:hypothetical protein
MVMVAEPQDPVVAGHAFISYVREDLAQVDRLQRVLQDAGIPVWLDRSDLWPGEDWQAKIREAITDDALVFIACFSSNSLARVRSYQNEELVLAVEQLRLRRPDVPWLIPVRFDDCRIPDRDIGGGRRLSSLQRVDLFDDSFDASAALLVAAIQRILGPARAGQDRAEPRSSEDGRRRTTGLPLQDRPRAFFRPTRRARASPSAATPSPEAGTTPPTASRRHR